MTAQVVDLSECDLLYEVDVLRRAQLETGVQLLRLVAEFACSVLAARLGRVVPTRKTSGCLPQRRADLPMSGRTASHIASHVRQ